MIENQLAKNLGVSRTPIRDVIKLLAKEGLVKSNGSKGYCVVKLSKEDINEIHDIRILLETYALKNENTKKIVKNLKKIRSALEKVVNSDDFVRDMIDLDEKFHEAIVFESNNKRLKRFFSDVCMQMRVFWQYTYTDDCGQDECGQLEQLKRVQEDNQKIIDALEDNNTALAMELITKHINKTRDSALHFFKSMYSDLTIDT